MHASCEIEINLRNQFTAFFFRRDYYFLLLINFHFILDLSYFLNFLYWGWSYWCNQCFGNPVPVSPFTKISQQGYFFPPSLLIPLSMLSLCKPCLGFFVNNDFNKGSGEELYTIKIKLYIY